jgi:hypothetical protein
MTILLFTDICLATVNNNTEGWLQILFPIIFLILIAIILAISGIFKSKSYQSEDNHSHKPVQTTQSSHMRIQVNTSSIQTDREKVNIKQHSRYKTDRIKTPKSIEPKIVTSQMVEEVKEGIDLATESFKMDVLSSSFDEEFLDLISNDQFKKSILLTEILSKPLSMRESGDF